MAAVLIATEDLDRAFVALLAAAEVGALYRMVRVFAAARWRRWLAGGTLAMIAATIPWGGAALLIAWLLELPRFDAS